MSAEELVYLSLREAADRVRERQVSPTELLDAALERTAAVEGDGAVEEEIVDHQRKADREDQIPACGRLGDAGQGRERARQERLLQEEIAAGVGGEPELGAERVVRPPLVRQPEQAQMRLGVEGGIGDPHLGHAHRDAREAMRPDVEEVVGHRAPS